MKAGFFDGLNEMSVKSRVGGSPNVMFIVMSSYSHKQSPCMGRVAAELAGYVVPIEYWH
jgi:hypothetical protein